jgi:hypothetical protein
MPSGTPGSPRGEASRTKPQKSSGAAGTRRSGSFAADCSENPSPGCWGAGFRPFVGKWAIVVRIRSLGVAPWAVRPLWAPARAMERSEPTSQASESVRERYLAAACIHLVQRLKAEDMNGGDDAFYRAMKDDPRFSRRRPPVEQGEGIACPFGGLSHTLAAPAKGDDQAGDVLPAAEPPEATPTIPSRAKMPGAKFTLVQPTGSNCDPPSGALAASRVGA